MGVITITNLVSAALAVAALVLIFVSIRGWRRHRLAPRNASVGILVGLLALIAGAAYFTPFSGLSAFFNSLLVLQLAALVAVVDALVNRWVDSGPG